MDHDLPDREEIACALDVLEVRLARQGQYDGAADINSARHLLRDADAELARLTAERDEAFKMIVLLMKQREWGAATGALYEDPIVKKARALVEACEGGRNGE